MNEKSLNARIILKYKTLDEWKSSNLVLKKGEAAVAVLNKPSDEFGFEASPNNTIGIKMGDGQSTFSALPWVKSPAADIYEWAKEKTKPKYTIDEIEGLSDYVGEDKAFDEIWLKERKAVGDPATFTAVDGIPMTKLQAEFGPIITTNNGIVTDIAVRNEIVINHFGKNLCTLQAGKKDDKQYLIEENSYLYKGPLTISFTMNNSSFKYGSSDFLNFYNSAIAKSNYIKPGQIKRVSDGKNLSELTPPYDGRFYFTCNSDFTRVILYYSSTKFCEWSGSITNWQIEYGETPTTYEACNNRSFIVDTTLGRSNGAGGMLTLNPDQSSYIMTDCTFVKVNKDQIEKLSDGKFAIKDITATNKPEKLIVTNFTTINDQTSNAQNVCYISKDGKICINANKSTVEDFYDTYSNLKIIYPTFNPLFEILDAHTIYSILGTNNIFSANSTITVTYTLGKNNLSYLPIAKVAAIESNGVASTNYNENKLVVANGKLVRTTTVIPHNTQFVIGINCVETTIADEYDRLLSADNALTNKIESLNSSLAMIAPIENNTTATHTYNVNRLFVSNENLYKATAVINVGDKIDTSVNCKRTSLDEEIALLYARI